MPSRRKVSCRASLGRIEAAVVRRVVLSVRPVEPPMYWVGEGC